MRVLVLNVWGETKSYGLLKLGTTPELTINRVSSFNLLFSCSSSLESSTLNSIQKEFFFCLFVFIWVFQLLLKIIAMISKGCFCQISKIVMKFVFKAFLYLNPWTVHVVRNWYCAHTFMEVTGKIILMYEIDLVCEHL